MQPDRHKIAPPDRDRKQIQPWKQKAGAMVTGLLCPGWAWFVQFALADALSALHNNPE
jgi:hypothetical protein